ncbi:hypothetical protein HPB51_011765 [Rhipicephalus microplus]|uniref:Fatty acid hydroxylase domain-containing protein n=1 Tax=Rhipicephalus microplus TaxID=6941 RepID=A0A9J6DNB1_RHIMP|nr:hypothetical protein HPB51_011765 [Rhipicephalus microplus]
MDVREIAKRLGYLLYVVSPNETSFEKLEEVPDYIVQASACGSCLHRLFDSDTQIDALPTISGYPLSYEMYISRQINLAWSGHQVHHSSEFYNLTTAMRQSALQAYYEPVLYLPLALAVSPSAYMVHRQFNRLFQFLIHTEVVHTLGPLELVLNTPSHHRVHHGRERYCIDKNYGGTLIIWDRLFGTFAAEQRRPAYGLTHSVNTFDPWTLQMHHFLYVCRQFWTIEGLCNKLSTLFKGPGWQPGKPRLGDPNDIPDVRRPVETYAPKTTLLCKIYVTVHFAIVVIAYVKLKHWSTKKRLRSGGFRCALMFVLDARVFQLSSMVDSVAATVSLNIVRATYAASLLGCLAASLCSVAWTVKQKVA